MDSNRHFVRVKWVDFEGDIYFSNRIRPIPINLSFSMGWTVGDIVLTNPARSLRGVSTKIKSLVNHVTKFSIGGNFSGKEAATCTRLVICKVPGVDQR